MNKITKIALPAILFLSAVGCGKEKNDGKPDSTKIPETISEAVLSDIPASLLLGARPENPIGIAEIKKTAKPGDKLTIKGEVGGRKNDTFNSSLAIFLLEDPTVVVNCSKKEKDGCPTPWDYCCEPKAKLLEAGALIQVKDARGEIVRKTLKGWNGLKELDNVVIVGKLSNDSSEGNFIVDAEGVFIEK